MNAFHATCCAQHVDGMPFQEAARRAHVRVISVRVGTAQMMTKDTSTIHNTGSESLIFQEKGAAVLYWHPSSTSEEPSLLL